MGALRFGGARGRKPRAKNDRRLTILRRGYSITRDAAGKIVRDAAQVALGDDLSIRLARGELGATVREKKR